MPPTTLVETEYFPLSPLRSDPDTPLSKHKVLVRSSRRALPKPSSTELRYTFFLRISAFIIIEAGFIILAAFAYNNTVLLHLPPRITLTEAKGGLTIISVVWHTIAVFAVKDIILHVFSAEWMEQYRKSGTIVLGETDVVSRMTSGILNQIQHFTTRTATSPFRLAFLSTLLLMALGGLGPSAITVNTVSVGHPLKIKVANLTMTSNLADNGADTLVVDRANLITRLEQLENSIYGFRPLQTNNLVPWPSSDLVSATGAVRYQSDAIHYQFSCSWKQPMVNRSMMSWNIDNQEWGVYVSSTIFDLEGDFTDASKPLTSWFLPLMLT
ncbi:hypothetical protein P691DRAFT_376996 [Macrolepiota fuliginosa MF-IS2]|uniref:Uncharacterized protein n=1 Tax=Macrolepiota fuliginosa MF-IS2 TaxID=1400762 RepID=A0A9P5X3T3_9AGAR|nr:hypothetical protein P691DRAFT_376996 [Macrolepiota fuliginosa MF-IS2]